MSSTNANSNNSSSSANAPPGLSSPSGPNLEQLVMAKIGASLDVDCIPSWDKTRIMQGKLVSFLDDDSCSESERIRIAKGIVSGPDSLIIAQQPDSPQYIPVTGMTLEALEEAIFNPPSKEREFFFDSQKEKDSFRGSLGKAASEGEDSGVHFEKLTQFIFRKVVVALGKGILRQVLILKDGEESILTVLKHRGLFSTEARKIEKIREKIRSQNGLRQTTLNFSPVPRFAEEEKNSEPPISSSSDSEEDLLSSKYGDLFAEDSPRLSAPSSLFKRRRIEDDSTTLGISSPPLIGSNAQVILSTVPFGSVLSPYSFYSFVGMFEEQLRLPECSDALLNAMDTP